MPAFSFVPAVAQIRPLASRAIPFAGDEQTVAVEGQAVGGRGVRAVHRDLVVRVELERPVGGNVLEDEVPIRVPGRALAEPEVAHDLLHLRAGGEQAGRVHGPRAYCTFGTGALDGDSLVASGGEGMKRRELIKGAAMVGSLPVTRLGAEGAADPVTPPAGDRWRGLKAGVASYTLRKMPVDAAVAAVKRVGLSYGAIKGFHLPLHR